MSLYAWKYDNDGTVIYTLSDEPSVDDYIYKANGSQYAGSELHIIINNFDSTVVTPQIEKVEPNPSDLTSLRIRIVAYMSVAGRQIPGSAYFVRYADGDILPVSKLKHNGVTYEITDEQARNSISNILPTQTGNDGKYLTTNGTTVSWATVQAGPKFLTFQNITASTWVSDNTYSEYSYKCVLTCTGVTSSDYAQVIFNPAQSVSGNYANVCLTDTDTVTIYSKVNTAISIPTITVIGSN